MNEEKDKKLELLPNTREELFLSGADLTPVTRREMYIKHIYDRSQPIPDYPLTREEYFLLKVAENTIPKEKDNY